MMMMMMMMMMINHGQVNYNLSCMEDLLLPLHHALILLTFLQRGRTNTNNRKCDKEGNNTRQSATRQGKVAVTQHFAF
jgi:hypothetical protein